MKKIKLLLFALYVHQLNGERYSSNTKSLQPTENQTKSNHLTSAQLVRICRDEYSADDPPYLWEVTWTLYQICHRVFWNKDDKVVVYFGINLKATSKSSTSIIETNRISDYVGDASWIFNFVSDIWTYMKETYGNFGPDPYLYLCVYQGSGRVSYKTVTRYSIAGIISLPKKNILGIDYFSSKSWLESSSRAEAMDIIVNRLANFVDKSAKGRYWTPLLQVWEVNEGVITPWDDIFTYDVYLFLNLTAHAQRYKEQTLTKCENFNNRDTYWFRDWFLPIYSQFGGNQVLNEYYQVIADLLPHKGSAYTRYLDTGGFIHFWSGATKTDLRQLANAAVGFGCNETIQKQYYDARERYPGVGELYKYEGAIACDVDSNSRKNIHECSSFEHDSVFTNTTQITTPRPDSMSTFRSHSDNERPRSFVLIFSLVFSLYLSKSS